MTSLQPLVTNTGPLIALSKLDCLEVMASSYGVQVPADVVNEWRSAPKSWPAVLHRLPPTRRDPLLRMQLDDGEASVIEAAVQNHIPCVLIDEQKARRIARQVYGLQVIGTARVLVDLRKAQKLGPLAPLFEQLRLSGYWMHENIVEWALLQVGESGM